MEERSLDAESIRALRRRLNLTQARFAARVGCAQGAVAMWERGQRTPRGLYARAIRHLMAEAEREEPGDADA